PHAAGVHSAHAAPAAPAHTNTYHQCSAPWLLRAPLCAILQAMTAPSTLLIVYHSHTGGTLQMVHALQQGAQQVAEALHVRLLHASDAHTEDVLQADAYVFATPENLAAISGLLKDFFDRTYYGALDRIQ